jgi:hypothetical protein
MSIRALPLALVAMMLFVPPVRGGTGLPDLVSVIDPLFPPRVDRNATVDPGDVAEGCAGSETGRTVVHFALSTFNEGTADLVLGDPGCPDCEEFPGPTCTNELFECSPLAGHGHPHFTKYAIYEIVPAPDAPTAAAGHKQSFCIEDTICPNQPQIYDCFNQGLQVGCQDLYPPYALGCQYVDVTDLPGGRYILRTTINYDQLLVESNYDNNVDQKTVEICEGIEGPRARLRARKSAPGIAYWSVKGRAFVQTPLLEPDAFKDGAMAHIEFDGTKLVDVVVPGRPGSGHCGPKDGWKKDPETGVPTYTNESGFLDRDCTVPADGLRRLRVSMRPVTRDGVEQVRVKYAVVGRTAAVTPVARVRATVGLGADIGPCWTGAASCDERGRCTGTSADGAFVD